MPENLNPDTGDHVPDVKKMMETPDHIGEADEMIGLRAEREKLLHALKNAWATLSYMPCGCGGGFVCGRCLSFNEVDALLKRVCGDDWWDREQERYTKDNPEAGYDG